jgi:hypothetical protein
MMTRKQLLAGLAVLVILLALYISYLVGRRQERPVIWLSDLALKIQGRKSYPLLNLEIRCANNKSLGVIQADINLTNGKVRIVRNDPGPLPSCD